MGAEVNMKKLSTTWAIMMAVSVSATAQTDTIAGRVHQLEGVTVTKRQQQRTLTSTAPLQQMDRSDMMAMGVTDMADALHRMAGITLRDYGGAGGMKTVAVRGFGAKHTGVSYDGIMLSDCQSGEIDLSRYALDHVERLALVIGDNDDIFTPARQAASSAVLHIQTLPLPDGDRQAHVTAQLKAGSFGFVSPFVRYAQSLSSHLAVSAMGEYTYAENDYPYDIQNVGITMHSRRTNSHMNSGHGELNLVWLPTDRSRLTAKVYYYDNARQLPGIVHYYTNQSGEHLHDRNGFAQLGWQTRWGARWALKAQAKVNWNESVYRDKLMPSAVNDASYWQREYYASAALLFVPSTHWAFDYSADYAYNNLNGSSWRAIIARPFRHSVLQSATAKYTSGRLTVTGRVLHSLYLNQQKFDATDYYLQASRADIQQNAARDMRRLSPSLSLSYRLTEGEALYVRASYKNIFRSPTFNESYYYHYGSTDLRPESTHQWNVGLTCAPHLAPQTEAMLTLDAYMNKVKDMIVAVPYNMFVWRCINVGRVRSIGLDATLRLDHQFSLRHRLLLAGSYSLQKVQNRTNPESDNYNKQIAYMPEHTASGSLGYENPWVNLSIHATAVSCRWPNNEHYPSTMIEGYADVGVTAYRQFRLGRHQVELRADVKNLFDKQYYIVARYPMPGRSWMMTVNYKL